MSAWQEAAKAAYLATKETEEEERREASRVENRQQADILLRLVSEMTGLVCQIDDVDMNEDSYPRLRVDGTTFSMWRSNGHSRLVILAQCPRCGMIQSSEPIRTLVQLGGQLVEFVPEDHYCEVPEAPDEAESGTAAHLVTDTEWNLLQGLRALIHEEGQP